MDEQEILDIFNRLYDDTYYDISKYVICNCSNIEDAKDIIQNIYLDVFKYISKKKNIDHAYMKSMAKNKIKDFYRFHYKRKIMELFLKKDDLSIIDNIPADIDIEKSIYLQFDSEQVWKYLRKKNIVISKIFYLYYYLGLTIKEISIELNITESNVKHYLYRSLKELNQILKKEGNNDV